MSGTGGMSLPPEWALPAEIRERIGERFGRQQFVQEAGHLVLVLHEVPEPGVPERRALVFWRSPDGVWTAATGTRDKAEIDRLLDRYGQAIDALEARLPACTRPRAYYEILRTALPLVRSLRNLAGVLQTARDAQPRLRDLLLWRDRAAELERAAELLQAEAKLGLDYALAEDVEQQSEASLRLARSGHRINLLIAGFLPVTALAAVFGMNVPSGLEDASTAVFLGIIVVGAAIGLVVLSRLRQ